MKPRSLFVPTLGAASKWTDSDTSFDDSLPYDDIDPALYNMMDEVQQMMWREMRSALKSGTLSGSANEPNEDFGLRPSQVRGINALFQAPKSISTIVGAFDGMRKYWWELEHDDMTYSWWNDHEARLPDNQAHFESGVPNRSFGYRMIALGLAMLLNGSGGERQELENLENAFRLMKGETRSQFGQWIFYLSCGMEKGNRPVAAEEMMMMDIIEGANLLGPDPPLHQPSDLDDDMDSHASGDTTVAMSPVARPSRVGSGGSVGSVDY